MILKNTVPFNWINVAGNKVGNKVLTDNREKIIEHR